MKSPRMQTTLQRIFFHRLPSILAGQYKLHFIAIQISQLVGKGGTGIRIGSFTLTLILGKESCFFVFFLTPIIPTYGQNMFTHVATNIYGLTVGTPWSGQIDLPHTISRGQPAIVEYITIFLPLVRRRSRHISIAHTMNAATVEDGR